MAATPLGRDDDGFLSPLSGHGLGGGVPYCGRDDRIPLVGSQSEERRRAGSAAEDSGRGRLHHFSEQFLVVPYTKGEEQDTVTAATAERG